MAVQLSLEVRLGKPSDIARRTSFLQDLNFCPHCNPLRWG